MADDPIEVQVVCAECVFGGQPCFNCGGSKETPATLAPGSLDEALMRWARAEMARFTVMDGHQTFDHEQAQQLERSYWETFSAANGAHDTAIALWRKERG